MKPLGILSGTILLQDKGIFPDLTEELVETAFGEALVFRSPEVVLIPRHGKDPQRHIMPHLINHAANLQAMKDLDVAEVIGVHSTGSLKRRLTPGMIVVPDDYLMLTPGPTAIRQRAVHITPRLSEPVRQKWSAAAESCGIHAADSGVYWQTAGPRLETRAEIAMMAPFVDLVGMTMASEAIVAQELGMAFASLCSVDNFAHGIGEKPLTMEQILRHARKNAETIEQIVTAYLERYIQTQGS
jgi:5'-methylthioadenosine phosphorylase